MHQPHHWHLTDTDQGWRLGVWGVALTHWKEVTVEASARRPERGRGEGGTASCAGTAEAAWLDESRGSRVGRGALGP